MSYHTTWASCIVTFSVGHKLLICKKPLFQHLDAVWTRGLMRSQPSQVFAILISGRRNISHKSFCKHPAKATIFFRILTVFFDFKPCGIHCRQYQQRQHGGHKQATGNSNRHGPPKDATHQGYHAENGCSCRQHNRPKTQDG